MPEINKSINFNMFHILLILLISNIIMNNNYEIIPNTLDYIINMERPGFLFLMMHVFIVYMLLSNVNINLNIYASVKFNL